MSKETKARVLTLIATVDTVLLMKDYKGDLKVALTKLEEAVTQVKESLELEDKAVLDTGNLECEYKIGVLCEHKDFPNTPSICDLGYCPLLKSL